MNWIASLARIVGATNPITAMAVQFSAELNGREVQERLKRLENPIAALHPDVAEVSDVIYSEISRTNDSRVQLSGELLDRYARVLAILDAEGLIRGSHALGGRFFAGFWLTNPSYVLYIAGLYEDPDLMERIVECIDSTSRGSWLRGKELAEEYALPLPVVRALFQLCEQRGLGILSKESGTSNYYVRA